MCRRKVIHALQSRTGQRGNALVEFAFVVTLLLSFMFGILDFGRALYTYHFVSNAAREGTRYAIVRGSTSPSPASQTDVRNYLNNVPLGISASAMTVTATWTPDNNPGSTVEVTVHYNFKFMMPFLPNFTVVMKSSSQMVISQ